MKTELVQTLTANFEGHAQQTENGIEYWLARDLQHLLGYSEWRNFCNTAISKARTACEVSGHHAADHFVDVNKTIQMPKGAEKEIPDLMLSRYACYLIAQNGGNNDFALIRSKGDQALFGKSTQAMKAQWKVPDNRPLADFAPTILLKAKDFATEITIFNARQHGMSSESAISREHVTNNEAVRDTLLERGIRPETLPAAEDVKKVERRLASEEKKSLMNPEGLGAEEES
jgi:DNA-damage-inducible protein D